MPVPNTSPVRRRSLLREDVYRAIRDAIVRGQIAPGEKLVDGELQEWLGVSRTPIREALLRLERTGLVTAVPGRSTMATPYEPEAVEQARVVAAELHALAVKLAVPSLLPADLEALREANSSLSRGGQAPSSEDCVAADDAFHQVFIDRSDNKVLAAQLEQVMPVLRRAEHLHFDSAQAEASVLQHEEIIAAAGSGDAEGTAALARRNWLALGAR
ncbi:GntR family transcriptional regulator [Nesterenkonia jeotgali]|uniref:DNA-binding GntR family transcriptional regulator n=1 Tax=Nesterenkonia jeotgali TaxID=317018 RepID=A0A0W8IJY4_9MICC|nr:GntR family transcriptional regulator [Nesterenkonia jeotgali]KUG60229.1 hypothetical protein AVL63_07370 [Nesterenkonia jeotgali]MBA8920290.1 DNA-binding GntR family transcriptional regulator [Nesterenkonia jeotgali]